MAKDRQTALTAALQKVEECRQQGNYWWIVFWPIRDAVEIHGIKIKELGISRQEYQAWKREDDIRTGRYFLNLVREGAGPRRVSMLPVRIKAMRDFLTKHPNLTNSELGLKRGERKKILSGQW